MNLVVNLTPIKDLLIRGQIGYDVTASTVEIVRHPQWSSTATGTGIYDQSRVTQTNPTINVIASYKKEFGKFSASLQAGYHQQEQASRVLSVHGERFLDPNFQSINNCDILSITTKSNRTTRRLQGIS